MLSKQEYRKQLEEELKREKINLDSATIDAFAEFMYSQHEYFEHLLDGFDIEERIRDNMAPDDSIVETSEHCDHKWKKYTGLRDIFDYCDLCGIKKT